MKNFWRKINYLLITVLIINAIINPVLGIGIVRNINHNNLQKIELDFSGLSYISSDQANNEIYDSLLPFNKQNALFDDLLIKELNFIESSQQHDETLIKIIILFKDGISKSERIELIDSVFDEIWRPGQTHGRLSRGQGHTVQARFHGRANPVKPA